MMSTDTRQKERAQLHSLARRHDVGCNNLGLYLNELQELIDKFQRERIESGPRSGPFVSAMRRAGARPMPSVWAAIDRQAAAEGVTPAQVFEAAEAWLMNGNRVDDARGVLDWAKSGKRSNREGRATERQPDPVVRRYLPDDPSAL